MTRITSIALILLMVTFSVFAGGQGEEQETEQGDRTVIEVVLNQYYRPAQFPDVAELTEQYVAEYEAENPEIDIQLIPWTWGQSESDYRTWLTARVNAGDQPHIAWEQYYAKWEQPGRWLQLDEYITEPNPYAPEGAGAQEWQNMLPDFVWSGVRAPDSHYYSLALEWVETGIFFNREIFEEVGVSSDWSTWEEFVDAQQAISEAGYAPLFVNTASGWSIYQWVDDIMTTALFSDVVSDMFMDKYIEQYAQEYDGQHWRTLTNEEVARAIYDGTYTADDPRFRRMLELIGEWSDYWIPGYSTINYENGLSAFLSGRVAMAWLGTWSLPQIEESAPFDWGVTYLPPIGRDANPDVAEEFSDVSFRVGGSSAAAQYGLTTRAEEDGVVEEALDFLKWLTVPDRFGNLILEAGSYVPMIRGVDAPESLQYFAEEVASFPVRAFTDPVARWTPEAGERYNIAIQRYLVGENSLDETVEEIQGILDDAVATQAEENGYDWYQE